MMYRMTCFVAVFVVLLWVVPANAGLVHQWHLDDNTATDSVGSLDGTPNNTAATANLSGQAERAMEFDGSTTSVTFTDTLTLGNTGTLALLVRPDAIFPNTTYPFQSRKYIEGVGQNDRLYVDVKNENGKERLRFSFGDLAAFDRIEITGRAGTWLYTGMTWTYDSTWNEYTVTPFCTDTSGTVFMNTASTRGGSPPSGGTLAFALGPDGFSGKLQGALDEISIHDTALTLSELQANYDALASGEEPIPGDLNDDGFVGGDDLDIVRSFWGQNVTPGDLLSGDPSEDGFVGGDDLDIVRANWGTGTPPAPSAVPEPASWCLLLAGALGLLWRRKRV